MSNGNDCLGRLVSGLGERDAVHVAIAPIVACGMLDRGERFTLNSEGHAIPAFGRDFVGIVDPFLEEQYIHPGQCFWGLLIPNTVTDVKHTWSHPAFDESDTEAPDAWQDICCPEDRPIEDDEDEGIDWCCPSDEDACC